MAGQILYVLAASLALCLLILASTLLAALPNLTFSNEWSRLVRMMVYSGRIAIPPEQLKLSMSTEILALYSPWAAFGHSAALFYLLCCLYGLSAHGDVHSHGQQQYHHRLRAVRLYHMEPGH